MLVIHHWEPNASSGKPILAALEKGVGFESRYVDLLGFDQHSPEYLKINPNGTIPSMVHDGVLIAESTAMMEYIDEAFEGPPLRPSDPFERWRMRWWCRFFDQFVGPSISMFGWSCFVGQPFGSGTLRSSEPASNAFHSRSDASRGARRSAARSRPKSWRSRAAASPLVWSISRRCSANVRGSPAAFTRSRIWSGSA